MLAEKRYTVVRPVACRPRRRRRTNFLRGFIHNRMACVLLLAVGALLLLIPYAGVYARATEQNYLKVDLLSQVRDLRMENESLRLRLESLRQPDEIAAFALENGMEQSTRLAYLKSVGQPNLARNTAREDPR